MTLAERVEQLVAKHGSLRAAARAIQVEPSYLSRLRSGERVRPLKLTLTRMGLRAVWTYEPLDAEERTDQFGRTPEMIRFQNDLDAGDDE